MEGEDHGGSLHGSGKLRNKSKTINNRNVILVEMKQKNRFQFLFQMVTSVLIPFYIVLVVINKDTGAFYTWFPVWVALILAFVVLKLYAAIKLRNAVDIVSDWQ